MQNQIQQFHNDEFGSLDILMIDGKPYFPATECAEKLGYSKARNAIERHCRYALKRGVPHPQSPEKTIEMTFIPEGDLYRLIIRSKLPAAVRFEAWVCDTILPSIRKFGAFATSDTLEEMMRDPKFADALIKKLAAEHEKVVALAEVNKELAPKARYYDLILHSKTAVPVTLIAKDYGLSAMTFNEMLHALRIQYYVGGTWVLYQEHTGKGFTITRTYYAGENASAMHTCWTQKGRLFLYETLKAEGIIPLMEIQRYIAC